MNSRSSTAPAAAVRPDLVWIHDGVRHRATVWPDVTFAREGSAGRWIKAEPSDGALASAALGVGPAAWRRFLEFVPAAEREFLERFTFSRLGALLVLVRCPGLLAELTSTPALTAYLAAHRSLRGGGEARWAEIAAVQEREGIFGVLQWLGLPSSRQTLGILRQISDPDLPVRLLEPLRSALWEPEVIWSLAHTAPLTDEQLARACHALAA
ncbi:MAG: hypothetical protein HZC55_17030 [Verrucomicrobia bacterium]|nr:hypothetical protein [Verrucomicrobiota bacterium]